MTSLAEQLRHYALPQTDVWLRDKTRPSFIFDPKEAAGLRLETFYQIGLDGFEDLVEKNGAFEAFRETLFAPSATSFERSVQSAEANRALNANIRRFLTLLSPYFMLTCAHKAFEWLIYRFHAHEYNHKEMLMLVLPYHETNLFVRVIQLLKFDNSNDCWYFLSELQKSGVHLTQKSLIKKAVADVAILKFTCELVENALAERSDDNLSLIFNFYCMVFAGVIENSTQIVEVQLSPMLALILKGLQSSNVDFVAASFMVVARLVAKVSLNDLVLDSITEHVCTVGLPELQTETILCLLLLYQNQKQYRRLTATACYHIVAQEWLTNVLQQLNAQQYCIMPLVEPLVSASVQAALHVSQEMHRDFLSQFMQEFHFKDKFIGTVIDIIIDASNVECSKLSEVVRDWLNRLIAEIERAYPAQFDQHIRRILSKQPDENEQQKSRQQNTHFLLLQSVKKFDLFGRLYHANECVRLQTLEQLLNDFDSLPSGDQDMVRISLADRLRDDKLNVVRAALKLVAKMVDDLTEATLSHIKNALYNIVMMHNKDATVPQNENGEQITEKATTQWRTIQTLAIKMLCRIATEADKYRTLIAVVGYVLNGECKHPHLRAVVERDVFSQHPLLTRLKEFVFTKQAEINKNFVQVLESNAKLEYVAQLLQVFIDMPSEQTNAFSDWLAIQMLSRMMPRVSGSMSELGVMLHVVRFFDDILKRNGNCTDKKEGKLTNNSIVQRRHGSRRSSQNAVDEIEGASASKWTGSWCNDAFNDCVLRLLMKLDANVLTTSPDYCDKNRLNGIIFGTIPHLIVASPKGNNKKKAQKINWTHMEQLLDHYFGKNGESKAVFLLKMSLCAGRCLPNAHAFQKHCLIAVKNLLIADIQAGFGLAPYLLSHLLSDERQIRHQTLNILQQIESFYPTLATLREYKVDIVDLDGQSSHIFAQCADDDMRYKCYTFLEDKQNSMCAKYRLLSLLERVNVWDVLSIGSQLCLDAWNATVVFAELFQFNVRCLITPSIATHITEKNVVWHFIEKSLCVSPDTVVKVKSDDTKESNTATLMLQQLDSHFFSTLNDPLKAKLLNVILDSYIQSPNTSFITATTKFFKHLEVDAQLLAPYLKDMRDAQSAKMMERRKQHYLGRRPVPTVDILETAAWNKGITVLELIQDKKRVRDRLLLLPVAFGILKRCLEFDEQTVVEYAKQLALALILHCCELLQSQHLDDQPTANGHHKQDGGATITAAATAFDMVSIVQCIRASQNPQTHQHALLVLAHTAQLYPRDVLHHVMAIFTFMGSCVLRHDDSYTHQIINQIVDTIVPILVRDGSGKTKQQVLRVFVDSIVDVPEHRRLPLYTHLLHCIGAQEQLHVFLLLLFEVHVKYNTSGTNRNTKRLDIASELCHQFDASLVLNACVNMMNFLLSLPDIKRQKSTEKDPIFDQALHTPKQFRHYKYLIVSFQRNLMLSLEFRGRVEAVQVKASLEDVYKQLIIKILTFVQQLNKASQKNYNEQQAEYWRVFSNCTFELLAAVNAQLDSNMFLQVTRGLIIYDLVGVKNRSLDLLNVKLQQYDSQNESGIFEPEQHPNLYTLIDPLMDIIGRYDEKSITPDYETLIQTALNSIRFLAVPLAQKYADKFVEILNYLSLAVAKKNCNLAVKPSMLVCIGELCACLRANCVPSLHKCVPNVLKIMKKHRNFSSSNPLLSSWLACISRILDTVPAFLSPFIRDMLVEVSLLAANHSNQSDELQSDQKVQHLCDKFGKVIPVDRVLLPSIEHCYKTIMEKQYWSAIVPLLNILKTSLTALTPKSFESSAPFTSDITNFFMMALDLRSSNPTLTDIEEIENAMLSAFTAMVLKMSETTFRPVFYRLFDWAIRCSPADDRQHYRIVTFYNLTHKLADSLHGLFNLFAGHLMANMTLILAQNSALDMPLSKADKMKLVEKVLLTLTAIFTYDQQKFINKERFEMLMHPLADLLDLQMNEATFELLSKCIVQFAVATSDDSLWRRMNHEILMKTRHPDAAIRIRVLSCFLATVHKIGEDFLSMWPESSSFLAELMEDSVAEVEIACKKALQEIEKVTGQSLQF